MLPYALKLVWFIGCLTGGIASSLGLVALGQASEVQWFAYGVALSVGAMELAFCLGMIWEMDPFKMPRAFCIAQSVIINLSSYFAVGFAVATLFAATEHILRPRTWGNIRTSFQWRRIYFIPAVLYPCCLAAIQFSFVFSYDAIQPAEGIYCGPTRPLWIRLTGEALPLSVLIPLAYLTFTSIRAVTRTMAHINRAQKDGDELHRRMRLENARVRVAEEAEQQESSVETTSFPTFAPLGELEDKTLVRPRIDVVSVGESSSGPMSATDLGHNDSELDVAVEVVKDDDDEALNDEGTSTSTFRLGYAEGNVPRRNSRRLSESTVRKITAQTSTIYYLILLQVFAPFILFIQCITTVRDMIAQRSTPSPFGTVDVIVLLTAWGLASVTLPLPHVRKHIRTHFIPRWLRRHDAVDVT